MKCPYCNEEIEYFSKVCSVCGEHIAPIYSIVYLLKEKSTDIIKWLKIGAASIIAFVLLITGVIYTVKMISENRLTDNGYRSIQLTYTPEGSLHDAFSAVAQQEQDLIKFLVKSKNPKDNSRLFGIFMDNLEKASQYFFDNYSYDKSLSEQGLITATKITDANPNPVKITDPELNVFKVAYLGAIGLIIDNEYIIKSYCQYLTADWKEYFSLSKQEFKDLETAHYNDDGISMINAYSKWAKKWNEFLNKYPNFHMNGFLYEKIQEYGGTINRYNGVF